jgi:hypothetical protein
MSQLTLDSTISDQFRQIKEPVELLDSVGNPLGTFTPVGNKRSYSEIEVPFSVEELRRFANEPNGRTLGEILADLKRS